MTNADTTRPSDAPAGRGPLSRGKARQRTKLVFVIDNMNRGGTELNAVRVAERLDRERFDLRVICLGRDGPLTERYRAAAIPVRTLGLRSFYGPSMLRSGWQFVRYLRSEGADIVHAHDVYSNIFVAAWARLGGVPVVIASRRWWHSLPSRALRIGTRLAFTRADAVLANSPQVARSVVEEAGVAPARIRTITNFVDDGALGTVGETERSRVRREWGVPAGAVVIGCVARLNAVKDHRSLLLAFRKLRERVPDVRLVLIGGGLERATLEALAGQLALSDAVHFAGELAAGEGGNLHRGLDVSVLASRTEGFPNTLVEAMAAGVPVVATAVGGVVDAVVDGKAGLLVPPADPDQLAAALERLVANPLLRRQMGMEGLSSAERNYAARPVVDSLARMYDDLLVHRAR